MLYPDLWHAFTHAECCLGADRLDYPEWHLGRARYALWAIDAEIFAVAKRLEDWRERLRDFLVAPYERPAHVTVAVCGFPCVAGRATHEPAANNVVPARNDDALPAQLAAQEERLRALRLPPFTLRIRDLNSFASAPFLEVEDETAALSQLRAAVAPQAGEFRSTPYVPHVTVGIYSGAHRVSRLLPLMTREAENAEPIMLRVGAVGLYSYDTAHIGSPLRLDRRVTLTG